METYLQKRLSRRKFLRNAGLTGLSLPLMGPVLSQAGTLDGPNEGDFYSLPKRDPSSAGNRVIVIGAGLAGLSAATELRRAGHDVTVLEARSRPGGRVRTLRDPFADGLHSEVGAVVFSDAYKLSNKYIDDLGLKKLPYAFPDLPALYHVNGLRFSVPPQSKPDWPYSLSKEEAELGPIGIVVKYLAKVLPKEITQPELWNSAFLRTLDQISLADFLRQQGASEGAIKLIGDALYFGWDSENASALSIAVTDIGLFFTGGGMFVLEGGNQQLPDAMALRISEQIQYGVAVTDIHLEENGVRVLARRGNVQTTYSADHIICTVPATVLQSINISPAPPKEQRNAVSQLPYHQIVRAQMQVQSAFWRDEGVSGSATTDLFGGRLDRQPYTDVSTSGKRAILDALIIGEDAGNLLGKSDEHIFKFILPKIEKIHPDLGKYRENFVVKRWNSDPYTKGGWSWPQPGFVSEHLNALRKPHGRMHFAGEHTSILRATMEGALRSGVRAAREVEACRR